MKQVRRGALKGMEDGIVSLVNDSFGNGAVSVIIYGSYLRSTYAPGVSDVNVLIVLEEASGEGIRRFGQHGRRFLKRHNVTPLILTRSEFLSSADVFPMEYLDIVERHTVLSGPDLTEKLDLSRDNLRHQVEHQLRGSLVSLRQLVSAIDQRRFSRTTLLKRELRAWYGSVSAVLRGLLRLKGVAATPESPDELVTAMNTAYGLEAGPLLTLVALRQGGKADVEILANDLVDRLTTLVAIVDTMEGEAAG